MSSFLLLHTWYNYCICDILVAQKHASMKSVNYWMFWDLSWSKRTSVKETFELKSKYITGINWLNYVKLLVNVVASSRDSGKLSGKTNPYLTSCWIYFHKIRWAVSSPLNFSNLRCWLYKRVTVYSCMQDASEIM